MQERTDEQRRPICGKGVFTDVVYEDRKPGGPELRQAGDSYEVLLFSCGHDVRGAPLAVAEPDRMTVERRQREETAELVEPEPSRTADATEEDGRGGTMSRFETPDPDPGPLPGPLPTPQPEPGPIPQPEPPTPEPSPRPEPPPDSEPPIRA